MWNLLEHIDVVLPCNLCQTTYEIPASLVRDSQHLLAEGCTGWGVTPCDATFYASLVAPDALAGLLRAWDVFCHSAELGGGVAVALHEYSVPPSSAALDQKAVERWEDEGGSCTASATSR